MRIFLLSVLQLCSILQVLGQESTSSQSLLWASFDYGYHQPWGDLKDRFGSMFSLTGEAAYLATSGFFIGVDHRLLFGSDVKEDVLANLRTIEGGIIGRDQQFADIFLRSRGQFTMVKSGYFLNSKEAPDRKGLLITLGLGWLQHKIRIVDDFDAVVQVLPPYDRGYDQLTSGFAVQPALRYLHLSENRLVNFYFQVDVTAAFTANRRGIHYSRQEKIDSMRSDGLLGARLGWIIPIYLQKRRNNY